MKYKINSIEELNQYFKENNIDNSNDLGKLGIEYWNNELKLMINPELFKKPKTKEELKKLIKNDIPLLLINTFNIIDFNNLFNIYYLNLKSKEYWNNPMNYSGFWDTNNVKDISFCFYEQQFFNQRIYWNTKNVKKTTYLFFNCINLNQEISFYLPNCKYIADMFANCRKLNKPVKLKNMDNVEYTNSLFYGCKKLEFNNIESIINQLIIKISLKNINEILGYQIPEKYKKKINQKSFYVVNQI